MTGQVRGAVAVLLAAALFGTSATSLALLTPGAPGPSVAAMRLLVGALGLVVVVLARGGGADLSALWKRPATWLMGAAVAGYQAFFFMGTARAGVAVGTLISLAAAPFMISANRGVSSTESTGCPRRARARELRPVPAPMSSTAQPEGLLFSRASAMTLASGCAPKYGGFRVSTQRS